MICLHRQTARGDILLWGGKGRRRAKKIKYKIRQIKSRAHLGAVSVRSLLQQRGARGDLKCGLSCLFCPPSPLNVFYSLHVLSFDKNIIINNNCGGSSSISSSNNNNNSRNTCCAYFSVNARRLFGSLGAIRWGLAVSSYELAVRTLLACLLITYVTGQTGTVSKAAIEKKNK